MLDGGRANLPLGVIECFSDDIGPNGLSDLLRKLGEGLRAALTKERVQLAAAGPVEVEKEAIDGIASVVPMAALAKKDR